MQNQGYLEIINEPPALVEERTSLKKELETLRAAQKVVKRDPEYYLISNTQSFGLSAQGIIGRRKCSVRGG
jgi:hypothetical protein